MELGFRKPVMSRDGRHIGHVDGLILKYNTHDVESFIVQSGVLLEHDRLVSREFVDSIEPDGTVTLKVTLDEVKRLPEFVEREFVIAKSHDLGGMPDEWVAMGTGSPPVYFGTESDSLGYGRTEPFYGAVPVIPPEVMIESNVPFEDVVLDEDTDVLGSDGRKIGTVDEVHYGPDGRITGFVVKAGFLLRYDVEIPADWVESVGEQHVRLRVSAENVREARRNVSSDVGSRASRHVQPG